MLKVYDIQRSSPSEIYKVYSEDYERTERRVLEMMRKIGKVKVTQKPVIRRFESNSKDGSWKYNLILTVIEYKPSPNLRYSYDLTVYSIVNDSRNVENRLLVMWPSVLKETLDYEEIVILTPHSIDRYYERTGITRPETFEERCKILVESEFVSKSVAFGFFEFPTYREHRFRTESGVFLGRSPDPGSSFLGVKKVQLYNTFVSDKELEERDDIIQADVRQGGMVVQELKNLNHLMNLSNAELRRLKDSGVDLESLGLNIV